MKNFYYEGCRFKNGNVNLRFSPVEIKDIQNNRFSDIEMLSFKLESLDCYFIGENFCISNYAMGCMIYSSFSDRVFILDFTDIDRYLMKGKTLKLIAMKIDNDTREIIERG